MTARYPEARRVVLITGAFSGIGQAIALAMAEAGWLVYASGRSLAKSGRLRVAAEAHGLPVRPIVMDVTDEQSIDAAMARIRGEAGRLDALVNNAGLAVHGAVTEISNAQYRLQFDTNTIGPIAVSRAALEIMREAGHGRIINISSYMGKVSFPASGAYAASKHALEALSDAMRLEIRLAGPEYHVVLVQVPAIRTHLGDNAIYAEYGDSAHSLYGRFNAMARDFVAQAYDGKPGPEIVARVVLRAAEAARPKPRYSVNLESSVILALRSFLPDRAFDGLVLLRAPRLKRQIAARKRACPAPADGMGVQHGDAPR